MEEPRKLWGSHTMNAPWGLLKRLTTAVEAIKFFNLHHHARNCEILGRNPDSSDALSLMEFVDYLETTSVFGDQKLNFFRVAEIVNAMAREGILQNVGSYGGKPRFFNDCFLFMFPGSQNVNRVKGQLWLAPALGPELIYYAIGNGVVQITGKNDDSDDVAGSGTILSDRVILTAKHVVEDMQVDRTQMFQGIQCHVGDEQIRCHDTQDVAIIRLEESLKPVNGLVFHPPRVGHTIHVLGFPHSFIDVSAIRMRSDPVYRHIQPTRFTDHHSICEFITAPMLLNILRGKGLNVHDVAVPLHSALNCAVIQMTANAREEVREALLNGMALPFFPRLTIAVDEDVDIHDMNDVMYALSIRVDPATDIMTAEGIRSFNLEPISTPISGMEDAILRSGSRLGIDAYAPTSLTTGKTCTVRKAQGQGGREGLVKGLCRRVKLLLTVELFPDDFFQGYRTPVLNCSIA